jgi:hypothetical protein
LTTQKSADTAVVVFGFGEPLAIPSNRVLADFVKGVFHHVSAHCVYITDRDVAGLLHGIGREVCCIDPSRRPTTWRLAVEAVALAQRRGYTELHVVAMPCHARRCMRDLHSAAHDKGVAITFHCTWLPTYSVYSPTAETWITRSPWIWWPMEISFRILSTLFPGWYKRRGM